jgi:hypothetical protein
MKFLLLSVLVLLQTGWMVAQNALTVEEKETLTYLLEEVKVAQDVCADLGEKWHTAIFQNIGASESRHLSMLRSLAEEQGVAIPASISTATRGQFQQPALLVWYQQLTAQGAPSQAAALEVGALMEEHGINELKNAAAATENPALTTVYSRLLQTKHNHLRSFVKQMEAVGAAYTPTILDANTYAAILTASEPVGCGGGQQGNKLGAACCSGGQAQTQQAGCCSGAAATETKGACRGEGAAKAGCGSDEMGKGKKRRNRSGNL